MNRLFLIILGWLFILGQTFAQNKEYPNAIHAKLNVIDYGLLYNGEARLGEGFEIGYYRHVAPFLNVGVPFKLGLVKLPEINSNTVTTSLDFRLNIENMKDGIKYSPFLFAGVGYVGEQFANGHIQIPVGAGVNFRISRYAFIHLQGEYRKALVEDRDNAQLGLGFVYLLHKPEMMPEAPKATDMDGDSIPDIADLCPDVPGVASGLGCPDRDGDMVPDKEDNCPDLAGLVEAQGCPDSDGDGLADKDDKCPNVAGTFNGCPDTDGDGFPDSEDECPSQAGRWNGCPDTDFDGVPDKDDDCPNDPGPAANKGCPAKKVDTDNDGFPDDKDECPREAGTINGCPDRDKDHIADRSDDCPDIPGPLKGCPDKDADGIADKDDPCPDIAGKFGGCPDSDGDGVADNLDKCPSLAGLVANNGCPEIKKEVRERLEYAKKAVQFETGKSILKSSSFAILDEVVEILRSNPEYKLSISGHTDNIGDEDANYNLSTARAKTCFDYLIFRGVPSDRLRYAGFGEAVPVASNETSAGREMNRRVEFEIIY